MTAWIPSLRAACTRRGYRSIPMTVPAPAQGKLGGQQAHRAKAGYEHRLADMDRRIMDTAQRDPRQRDEHRPFGIRALGQQPGRGVVLADEVKIAVRPVQVHKMTRPDPGHIGPRFLHHRDRLIARRDRITAPRHPVAVHPGVRIPSHVQRWRQPAIPGQLGSMADTRDHRAGQHLPPARAA